MKLDVERVLEEVEYLMESKKSLTIAWVAEMVVAEVKEFARRREESLKFILSQIQAEE